MIKHAWKFLVAGAVVSLGACGEDGGGGPSFADSVSTAEALGAAQGGAQAVTYLAQTLNFGEPEIALSAAMLSRIQARPEMVAAVDRMRWVTPIAPATLDWKALTRPGGVQAVAAGMQASGTGCSFSGHGLYEFPEGPPVDENENGLPDDFVIEINCEQPEEYGGDTVVTFFRRQRIAMKEIAGSLWGVTLDFTYSEGGEDNHGNHEKIVVEQHSKLDIRAGGASHGDALKVVFSENWAGEAWQQGGGEEWNAEFDPASTIALGSALPDGDLTLGGRSYHFETDEPGASFTISTPTALAYNAACAAVPTTPPFTAGVLRGRLNNNSSQASFEVTFTSCGNFTVEVDGTYDEPVVAVARR